MATAEVQAGKVEAVIDTAKKAVAVMTERKLQGFQGYVGLMDRNTGKYVGIQFWDTEADAAAFTSSPLFRELMGPLMPLLTAPPVSEVYEVAVRA
jgi:heme-degrading monooxygenase HmoA